MKLTSLLLLAACLQVSAGGYSQSITWSGNDVPLQRVFTIIKQQTGYTVFYDQGLLSKARPVNVRAVKTPLEDFLQQVFRDQPLSYAIEGTTIVVGLRSPSPGQPGKQGIAENVPPLPVDQSGTVLNENGQPLEGASVFVKGTRKGASTDVNGRFIIKGADEKAILVISFAGYLNKEVKMTGSDLIVRLEPSKNQLDEVKIIAYGQTSDRLSTGNVSSVKAKDIEKAPVNNPLLAIAGRVPGVFITQTTGFAGTGVQVQVQGRISITSGTTPLYVIDGVPFVQSMLIPLNSIQGASDAQTGTGVSNPLAFINPQDIESIDVLKDADATAIYGSRAANGAILITTKKGKAGRTNVTVNAQHGFGQVGRKIKNLNTEQYLAMRKDAYRIQGLAVPDQTTVPASTNYDLTFWDQNRYTDWQKELIGGKAGYTDVQATVSGGTANTQLLLGTNYHRETTVMPGDFDDNRGGVHFNMTQTSANQRFKISFGGNYLVDKNVLPGADLTNFAMKLAPNAPALYDNAGNLNWQPLSTGVETWVNPVRTVLYKYKVNTNNTVGNADLSYRIWNTLTLKSTFGYTSLTTDERLIIPQLFYAPSTTTNNRSATYGSKKVSNWIIEPQLSYQLDKPYGKFDVLLGTTFQKNRFSSQQFSTSGYSNDGQLENITAATSVVAINALEETYNYNAVFGRLNYNFSDRYLLNLSLRRDGSSRFGSENQFNSFYGIGAGWVFTKESWWSDRLSFLSFGKLKASYGTTGNDQIGNYSFMSLYRTVGVPQPYGGGTTLRANSLSNPYLQWEETRKLNAGINLGFLADRILLNLNYYRNMSSNQLLGYNLPIITGFNSITENFDALVKNSGIEMAINTTNFKGKDFTWSTNLNITLPRNELVEFPGLATSSYATSLIIGKPLTITKAFKYAGVNPVTGRYNFEIPDKSLVEIPVLSRDETVTIDRTPKFYGGLQNSVSYKGISLDFLFQFVKQKGFDETRFGYSSPGTFSSNATTNQPVSVLNYWKQNGDVAAYQRPNPNISALSNTYAYASSIYSDAAWTDASYIRLKNLSISWTLPAFLLKQARLQQVRVYVQGQNLLTFTKYKGLDPENQRSFVMPPLRVVTLGIQVSL